ncbi:MAG: hypothetical protein AB1782_19570 [Cyanobacteriota bacterium]
MAIPTPRVFPMCPKCEGKNFSTQQKKFYKTSAIIVYCSSCGAILGIVNETEKQKSS